MNENDKQAASWPCKIIESDFEQDTITVQMQNKDYFVSGGTFWLSMHKRAEPVGNPDCWRCGGDGCSWCKDTHSAQPVQQAVAQDAARYEYLEKFTQCIKTPNGDLAWTIQLQQVLVGDTFGKAIDAAIEAEKAKGGRHE